MTILNEGGNIFKDADGNILTQRINKADVLPTLKWLEKITNLPHRDFMLGSTGRKKTSGDLDVAVNQQEVTKEELIQKLAAWCEKNGKDPKAWIRKTGISVHFLTPIRGNERKGLVQTDLMFGDPEWMKWSMAGSDDATAFEAADKQILMASIATAQGLKWSWQKGLIDRSNDQVITRNPQEIAQHLIGANGQADDLESVETILTKLRSRVDYYDLVADAKATFEKRGKTLPEGKDINRLRKLAGVEQVNEVSFIPKGLKGLKAASKMFGKSKPEPKKFDPSAWAKDLPASGSAREKLEKLIQNTTSMEKLAQLEKEFHRLLRLKDIQYTAEARYLIDVLRAHKADLLKNPTKFPPEPGSGRPTSFGSREDPI